MHTTVPTWPHEPAPYYYFLKYIHLLVTFMEYY